MTTTPQAPPRYLLKMTLIVLGFLLLPITLVFVVFPMLSRPTMTAVSEVDPADVSWMNVQMLNREELDGGTDIWPFKVAPEDYAAILNILRTTPEVSTFRGGTHGPWLGEIRLTTRSGQDATIRLYWRRTSESTRSVICYEALMGEAAARYASMMLQVPVPLLQFQIGEHMYEGYGVTELIRTALQAETRGTTSPR